MAKKSYKSMSDRINAAMARLSRDKWLFPEEVIDISYKLASCISLTPITTANHSCSICCHFAGMIKGKPPFYYCDNEYKEWIIYVENSIKAKRSREQIMVRMLQIKLHHEVTK